MPADLNLYVDLTRRTLVADARSAGRLDGIALHQGDIAVNVAIWFLERTSDTANPVTIVALPGDYGDITLAARLATDLEDELLLLAATFALVDEGGGIKHYDGVLNIDTEALETALANKTAIDALFDIELASATRDKVSTPVRHFPARITRDIHRGDEDVPAVSIPRPIPFDRTATIDATAAATPVALVEDSEVPATHVLRLHGATFADIDETAWTGLDILALVSGSASAYDSAGFGFAAADDLVEDARLSLRAASAFGPNIILGGSYWDGSLPTPPGTGLAVVANANGAGGTIVVRVWGVIMPAPA